MTNTNNESVISISDAGDDAQALAGICKPARSPRTHTVPTKQKRFAFNPKALDALKCQSGREDYSDALTAGLYLRVTPDKKTWSFLRPLPGSKERVRLALGTYPATTLDAARRRALEARAHLEAGIDPRIAMAPVEAPKTIAQLVEERLSMEVRGKLKSAADIEARFVRFVLPLVGDVPVKAFRTDPHYNLVIDPIVKRGHLRTAGLVHTDLVGLLGFARERGMEDIHHITGKNKDPKTVKERFLDLVEISAFWRELPEAMPRTKACQRILRLILVTEQRPGEVAGMTRGELDMVKMIWTIPAERSKNGFAHVVPLSALAVSIIREALGINSNPTEWLFPNDAQDGPLDARVISKTLCRSLEEGDFTVAKFTPHDLRRTAATQMSMEENGLEIPELVISHILNHRSVTKGSVTARVYNKNTYFNEKREALDKWGAFLARLVGVDAAMQVAA